jgi:hypothetical protein
MAIGGRQGAWPASSAREVAAAAKADGLRVVSKIRLAGMAFASDTIWDDCPRGNPSLLSIPTSWLVSGAVVLGLGVALAGWSLATVAAVHKMETSLSSTPSLLPESTFAPGAVALFDPAHRIEHIGDGIRQRLARHNPPAAQASPSGRADAWVAQNSPHKSGRVGPAAPAERVISDMPLEERFGEAASEAISTAHRRGSAFIRSRLAAAGSVKSSRLAMADAASLSARLGEPAEEAAVTLPKEVALIPQVPSDSRFAHEVAEAVPTLLDRQPSSARFGQPGNDAEKPSRIALAVIDSELKDEAGSSSPPLPSAPPARNVPLPSDDAVDDINARTDDASAEGIPGSVPLPTRRPAWEEPPARATRTGRTPSHSSNTMMAYARPDDGEDTAPLSGLARLFERKPRLPGLGSGVAVYDIRNAVVYMPNGEKLEAHSGLGKMVDKPRYVDEKNRGPTPPNTYKLVLRERRFHGVEAIRLLPVNGNNKYGRVGLLAHTYMLRGGLAQSNGCVVFKDYKRFLKAFKRGRITRLVVVPDMSHASPAVLASAARGA